MREHRRAVELHMLEKAGLIEGLEEQVPFVLAPAVVLQGRKKPALRYVLDFRFKDVRTGQMVYEDVKALHDNAVFRIKAHLMRWKYDIEITLT